MPPRDLRWSERAGRFIDARGRFISAANVRGWLDGALEREGRQMQRLAEQLRAREIDLISWELAMRRSVKNVQIYSATLAKGGRAQLTSADLGRIGAATREQYEFLSRLAQAVEDGLPLDGRFMNRIRLYAQSGRGVYHRTERREMERRGFDEERSVLHPADHCDLCVSEASSGWRPIGQMIPIGQRTCKSNDRCTVEYRKASAA